MRLKRLQRVALAIATAVEPGSARDAMADTRFGDCKHHCDFCRVLARFDTASWIDRVFAAFYGGADAGICGLLSGRYAYQERLRLSSWVLRSV